MDLDEALDAVAVAASLGLDVTSPVGVFVWVLEYDVPGLGFIRGSDSGVFLHTSEATAVEHVEDLVSNSAWDELPGITGDALVERLDWEEDGTGGRAFDLCSFDDFLLVGRVRRVQVQR